jgi:pilus assembly protein Flp/PilA
LTLGVMRLWFGRAQGLAAPEHANRSGGSSMFAYMRAVRRHVNGDAGASAVEYGLLIAAIAAVIVVVVFALGSVVKSKFSNTCKGVNGTASGSATCGP